MTRTRGATAVEYGLLLPALLAFVFGIIDVGRLLWTQTTLDRAVEAASRCAAIDTVTCGTATQIQTYAVAQAYGLNITTSVFAVGATGCPTAVQASLPFVFVIPWFSQTVTLTAESCYPA